MAPSRNPGSSGRGGTNPNIRDGTLCRQASPQPASVGLLENLESSVSSGLNKVSRFAGSEYSAVKKALDADYQSAARYLKSDYEGARCLFLAYIQSQVLAPAAIYQETGYEIASLLKGLIPGLLQVLAVVGATTFLGAAVGGAIGFFFGAVGAAPGAVIGGQIGFDVGTAVITWLGLGFLVVAIAKGFGEMVTAIRTGVQLAWAAGKLTGADQERGIESGAKELARACGILVRLILEGIIAYILKKGAVGATRGAMTTVGTLRSAGSEAGADEAVAGLVSKLQASRLGADFANWVEKNWRDLVENPKLRPKQPVSAVVQPSGEEALPSNNAGKTSKSTKSGTSSEPAAIADRAKRAQGSGAYPGVDNWKSTTLKPGTRVFQGEGGESNFFFPQETLDNSGLDAEKLWESLQVEESTNPRHPGYRMEVNEYEVVQDTPAAESEALSNPMHGSGGGDQLYVTDKQNLRLIRRIPLK